MPDQSWCFDDLREDIVDQVKDSREGQDAELDRIKGMLEDHQYEALSDAIQAIGSFFDDALAAQTAYTDAAKDRLVHAREDTQYAVKELYHKLEHGYDVDPYHIKEEIQHLIKDFDELIDTEGAAFENFEEENLDTFKASVSDEINSFNSSLASIRANMLHLTDAATAALNQLIATKTAEMDQEFIAKTDAINNLITDLTENFIGRFWEQLQELNLYV